MTPNPSEVVTHLRNSFENGKTQPIEFRIKQLRNLHKMYVEKETDILNALYSDLRKSKMESLVMEIQILVNDLKLTLSNIYSWTKDEHVSKDLANILDTAYIQRDPYGVVLVIGSWNYPLQLLLLPVQSAIAAGNCVVLKPSEISKATAKLLIEIIPQYLDQDCYRIFNGDGHETSVLLKEKFDYIFYTGSGAVGKLIHQAASKHLTPTTLELGGKSPCYLDDSANIEVAAKRIIWGKFINAGQTCVAPDYLICTKEVQNKFIDTAKKILTQFYGTNPKESPDLGRIASEKHFQRLLEFLKCGTVAVGGDFDLSDKYISPTIIIDAKAHEAILQEEIFGPIFPIVNVPGVLEAISYINSRDKPLALYIFSNNKNDVNLILKNTSSGGVCINDTVLHLTVDTLPFGGVGASGMGAYHGKYGFDSFSHKKSVLYKDLGLLGEKLSEAKYPPYNSSKMAYLYFMMAKRPGLKCFGSLFNKLVFVVAGAVLGYFWSIYGHKFNL